MGNVGRNVQSGNSAARWFRRAGQEVFAMARSRKTKERLLYVASFAASFGSVLGVHMATGGLGLAFFVSGFVLGGTALAGGKLWKRLDRSFASMPPRKEAVSRLVVIAGAIVVSSGFPFLDEMLLPGRIKAEQRARVAEELSKGWNGLEIVEEEKGPFTGRDISANTQARTICVGERPSMRLVSLRVNGRPELAALTAHPDGSFELSSVRPSEVDLTTCSLRGSAPR